MKRSGKREIEEDLEGTENGAGFVVMALAGGAAGYAASQSGDGLGLVVLAVAVTVIAVLALITAVGAAAARQVVRWLEADDDRD